MEKKIEQAKVLPEDGLVGVQDSGESIRMSVENPKNDTFSENFKN